MKLRWIFLLPVLFIPFLLKKPSNNRNWEFGFGSLSTTELINDHEVLIKNIHDTNKYFDETYDTNDLERVWFVMEPFAKLKIVAHTYFVFDFKDKEPIALSIEARREKGEEFDFLKGLTRQFDLYYSWGTERDATGRRAVKQNEPLYMYPLKLSHERASNLFITLANETNRLAKTPRFYNILTSNCTNELAKVVKKANPKAIPWYSTMVPPGYADNYLYDWGYIDTTVSKKELHEKYYITDIVKENYDEGFEKIVRETLLKE